MLGNKLKYIGEEASHIPEQNLQNSACARAERVYSEMSVPKCISAIVPLYTGFFRKCAK